MEASDWRILRTHHALSVVARLDLTPIRRRDPVWDEITNDMLLSLVSDDLLGVAVHPNGGWMLLQFFGDCVHGWAAWTPPHSALESGFAFIETVARELGAKYITFGSQRRGWDKIAPRLGYNRTEDGEYVKVIQ